MFGAGGVCVAHFERQTHQTTSTQIKLPSKQTLNPERTSIDPSIHPSPPTNINKLDKLALFFVLASTLQTPNSKLQTPNSKLQTPTTTTTTTAAAAAACRRPSFVRSFVDRWTESQPASCMQLPPPLPEANRRPHSLTHSTDRWPQWWAVGGKPTRSFNSALKTYILCTLCAITPVNAEMYCVRIMYTTMYVHGDVRGYVQFVYACRLCTNVSGVCTVKDSVQTV